MLIHLKLFIYIHIINHTFGVLILFTLSSETGFRPLYSLLFIFLSNLAQVCCNQQLKLFRETKLYKFKKAMQNENNF